MIIHWPLDSGGFKISIEQGLFVRRPVSICRLNVIIQTWQGLSAPSPPNNVRNLTSGAPLWAPEGAQITYKACPLAFSCVLVPLLRRPVWRSPAPRYATEIMFRYACTHTPAGHSPHQVKFLLPCDSINSPKINSHPGAGIYPRHYFLNCQLTLIPSLNAHVVFHREVV
jgi:hypothetical protein